MNHNNGTGMSGPRTEALQMLVAMRAEMLEASNHVTQMIKDGATEMIALVVDEHKGTVFARVLVGDNMRAIGLLNRLIFEITSKDVAEFKNAAEERAVKEGFS